KPLHLAVPDAKQTAGAADPQVAVPIDQRTVARVDRGVERRDDGLDAAGGDSVNGGRGRGEDRSGTRRGERFDGGGDGLAGGRDAGNPAADGVLRAEPKGAAVG